MAYRPSTADKLKILFVHGASDIGGAERELLGILERLPRAGYEPRVACPAQGQFPEELNRRGIPHVEVPLPPWRKLLAYPQRSPAVKRLREVVQNDPPALVHVNDMWWVPQTLRVAVELGIPVAAHVRQEIEPPKVRRYELEAVDLVFAVSLHVQAGLIAGGVSRQRLRVLYSGIEISASLPHDGIDLKRHLGLPAHAHIIGTVANVFPRKGYHVMLQAMPTILARDPETHYVIIGSGDEDYVAGLRQMADERGLQNHVHFLGHQDCVDPYLAGFDLYVHPALMEGFGLAVLEAMAMGRPVVATSTGGLPEIVEDGVTGLLVPAGNAESLATTVVELLADPDRALTMGHAGWQRARYHFSWEAMLAELRSGYAQIAQSMSVS